MSLISEIGFSFLVTHTARSISRRAIRVQLLDFGGAGTSGGPANPELSGCYHLSAYAAAALVDFGFIGDEAAVRSEAANTSARFAVATSGEGWKSTGRLARAKHETVIIARAVCIKKLPDLRAICDCAASCRFHADLGRTYLEVFLRSWDL